VRFLRTSPLVVIFLTIFIEFMGNSLLVPILPYIVQVYRSDGATIGFLGASFSLAQFLASPVVGSFSDRWGRRPVLLSCLLISSVGYLIVGFAHTLALLFVGRIIGGLAAGVVTTAQAYVVDISKPEDRTKNFGVLGAAFGLGFILGPAIGAALFKISPEAPLFTAAILALANAVLAYYNLPESLAPENRQVTPTELNPFVQILKLLQNSELRPLVLGFALFNFAFAGYQNNFAVFTRDQFQWGADQNGLLFAYVGVVVSLVQGVLIRFAVPRFGEERLAITGLALCVVGIGSVAVVPSGFWLFVTSTILPLGVGLCMPSLRGIISRRTSEKEQGRVIGGTQALTSLGLVLGPLWAGLTFDHVSPIAPYWSCALWTLLALALVIPTLTGEVRPSASVK
jgi:MFS transporter, DHA1 family, tetracycline resistance protein